MVRITTRLGEIKKELKELEAEMGDFKVGTIVGKLEPIIADEDVEFKVGDAKPIKIKKISIPANHIMFSCAYARNKVGHIIVVGEDTALPITMERSANYAHFVASLDGTVKRNDLIGVMILLPVELTR